MKRHFILTTLVLLTMMAWAQGPNNSGTYYRNADGKSGAALKTAFFNIISSGTVNIGYDGLIEAYKQTDRRADGKLRDWYSNVTNYTWNDRNGNNQEGAGWNREHSVPQSWFNQANPMKSDIVHVFPTDCYVNNRRSNYPFGEVNNATYSSKNNYSKVGSCKTSGYSGTVFEPNDEIKGDIARIYFYMVTRYQDKCSSWGNNVFTTANYGLATWTLNMMLRWSKQDPVDDVEIARNKAVYATQNNRNPFVDYPGLEDYIWGDKKTSAFSYNNYNGGSTSETVAIPVITPDAGTYYNQVTVTITCATENAKIYYTTNGAEPSEQSILYEAPFTLSQSSVIKAVAIKDSKTSNKAEAAYTIEKTTPESSDIQLCDAFFGTSFGGSLGTTDTQDLIGSKNGVTVTYSLASGSHRYCNSDQIRLYPGNTLKISSGQNKLVSLELTFDSGTPSTELTANGETMTDGKWTGNVNAVTIAFNGTSKHARLTGVKFVMASSEPSGIDRIAAHSLDGCRVIYNLSGQRVTNPLHGVYIVDGKKLLIP